VKKISILLVLLFLIFINCITPEDNGDTVDTGDSGDAGGMSDGKNWFSSTNNANWNKRAGNVSLVFDNTDDGIDNPKTWILGGAKDSSTLFNDVWYSEDGSNWTQATDNAGWDERWCFSGVIFDNTDDGIDNPKMWIMGGQNDNLDFLNDVWYSENGSDWTQATGSANWSVRYSHTSVVYDNKIWVIGGYNSTSYYQYNVWYSENGITWAEQPLANGYGKRYSHTSLVFDNTDDGVDNPKMWILGGFDNTLKCRNDVWYSEDGSNWTQATNNASWEIRCYHSSIVYDNKMWVIGGGDLNWGGGDELHYNDVWYSEDGSNWIQATDNAQWSERLYHSSFAYDNKMWVIAGGENIGVSNSYNDAWYSE